jgi:predicted MFS family arabinose efflux permease
VFFFSRKLSKTIMRRLVIVLFSLAAVAMVGCPLIPQSFNPAAFLLMLALCITFGKWLVQFKRLNPSPDS